MAKRVEEPLPEMEWTSLIDIIFQLLIFFMVTMSLGTMETRAIQRVKGKMEENLPALPEMEKLSEVENVPTGLLLHTEVEKEGKNAGKLVAYILDQMVPSIEEAKKDTLHTHGPWLLKEAKKRFKRRLDDIFYMGETMPTVEIRAHKDTDFGFILDVMNYASADSVEAVKFRLSWKKGE